MPRLKSAIKRVKIGERNRLRNIAYKTEIRTLIKKVKDLITKKDLDQAAALTRKAFSLMDKAYLKGIIHKNNAARKKAKISKWLKVLEPKA